MAYTGRSVAISGHTCGTLAANHATSMQIHMQHLCRCTCNIMQMHMQRTRNICSSYVLHTCMHATDRRPTGNINTAHVQLTQHVGMHATHTQPICNIQAPHVTYLPRDGQPPRHCTCNTIGHNYIGHNYIGNNCITARQHTCNIRAGHVHKTWQGIGIHVRM